MEIFYAPSFVRQYKILPPALKDEIKEKIASLRSEKNHESLHVHKLKGSLKDFYSFRINYKIRVVFSFSKTKKEIHCLSVGDHDIYDV